SWLSRLLQIRWDNCRSDFPRFLVYKAHLAAAASFSSQRVQVRQGDGHVCSSQILGKTAITHFAELPQLLDDTKRCFALGAATRAAAVYLFRILGQRPAPGLAFRFAR